ncbi:MAG: hypothetical protein ABR524_07140 [Thermoanaerobaculia bacterium]
MRRLLIIALGLLLVAGLSGCKLKKAMDEAQISDDLSNLGTTELMEKVADDSYDAPADGRLTDSQIQMYLKVREQEKKIAMVARQEMEAKAKKIEEKGEKSLAGMMAGFQALGSVADLMTADIRAAHELGYNTAEYQWVKGQVLEASGSVFQEQMQASMSTMLDESYAALKKQADEATDPQTKKAFTGMLADYEKNRAEMQARNEVEPSVAFNRNLLSKYENTLNALTAELAKYQENPGDAQKAMEEWQKKANAQ